MVMFEVDFKPKKKEDLFHDKKTIAELENFLKSDEKIAILRGPEGCGKRTFLEVVAKENGFHVVQYEKGMKERFSLFGEILYVTDNFSELKNFKGNKIVCIMTEYKKTPYRVILMNGPTKKELREFVEFVCKKKNLPVPKKDSFYERKDVRAVLLDLEYGVSERMEEKSILKVLGGLYNGNFSTAQSLLQDSSFDPFLLFMFLEYNMHSYNKVDYCKLGEIFSKIDLLRKAIISSQNWRMLRFVNFYLCSLGVTKKGFEFVKFSSPLRVQKKEEYVEVQKRYHLSYGEVVKMVLLLGERNVLGEEENT